MALVVSTDGELAGFYRHQGSDRWLAVANDLPSRRGTHGCTPKRPFQGRGLAIHQPVEPMTQ
jgi:hypothetical protein